MLGSLTTSVNANNTIHYHRPTVQSQMILSQVKILYCMKHAGKCGIFKKNFKRTTQDANSHSSPAVNAKTLQYAVAELEEEDEEEEEEIE